MNYAFKIEKGVPLSVRAKTAFPLDDMEVGDSFPCDSPTADRLRPACHMHKLRTGKTFTVRKQVDGSYRCWRLA